MITNQKYYIVTTFRSDLDFDNNFYNLIGEKLNLNELGISCTIVAGSFNNKIEYSLLIIKKTPRNKIIREVKRIMKEYFQECYLDINNNDAYFVNQEELVIKHLNWHKVTRQEAIKNGDFTYIVETDNFYVAK